MITIILLVFIALIIIKFTSNSQYIKKLIPVKLESFLNNSEYYINFHKKNNELVYLKINDKYLTNKGKLVNSNEIKNCDKLKIVLGLDNPVNISLYNKSTNQYVINNNGELKLAQVNILKDNIQQSATFRVLYKSGNTYLQNNRKYLSSNLNFNNVEPTTTIELINNTNVEEFNVDKGDGHNRNKKYTPHLLYHNINESDMFNKSNTVNNLKFSNYKNNSSELEKFEDITNNTTNDVSGIFNGNDNKYFENVLKQYDTTLYKDHITSKDLSNDNAIDYLKDMNSKFVNKNIETQLYIDNISMKIEKTLDKYGEYLELIKLSKASNMYNHDNDL